ncbi:MAG TPA: MFS transporter [Syntrophorhabdus sp.]|jgi:sugar phosphate permease|nr:MFS transporter [Syntrophorhabdus sp.]MDI9557392.1 MFS transporter [Pseudomonadota bacterium]OPX94387.1 MAG: putative sulfoacetate transporter SauU [Syntrophorhabdus sp. PtaB.Bin027]OQB78042.1 MAG: putative sulfoacetate transporter SauU [Deltaproteobacteria bacterium ADurb.Bin135]MBP8745662.1 MFS transporter [Syntrophorhabdus sp.]
MKRHYAWVIAFTGTLVTILAHGFGRMSYSVILPSMKEGLALNYTQLGSIATGNFIGYLSLAIIGGFLAARFGVRRVVFVSLVVIGVSLFLTGFSKSFLFAFFMRLISGLGNGGSYVPIMALPAAWFVMRKRGLATGIVSGGIGTGLFISGIILPPIISAFDKDGWRYAWFVLGIAVFILAFVCYAFLRNTPQEKGLTMYGGEEEQRGGPKVTLFSAFRDVVVEPEIWKLGCVYFMYGFSYIIYLTFFMAYLTKEVGVPSIAAGRIFAFLGIISIFCGVIYGWISDVLGRKYGSMIAYINLAISYIIFFLWKDTAGFYVSAFVFGIAAFSIPTIMAAASGDAVGGRLAPAGLGFITLFFGIGQALGPFIGGWLKDVTGTFTHAFALSAAVSLLGAVGSLILRKKV